MDEPLVTTEFLHDKKNNLFCHAVSTYKKNTALRVWLETFLKHHSPEHLGHLVITDDNKPEAEEVYEEFKDRFAGKLHYIGGSRAGIARNKNRGIRFFLEQTQDRFLVLWDDDIQFVGSGIEAQLIKPQWGHVTGYLGDPNYPNQWDIKLPFFMDFQAQAETEFLWFCQGSQGVMMFMERTVVENVGYFDTDFKGLYGYEHSIYSNRIHKFHAYYPDWFAILKDCEYYFITQQIANNYTPDYLYDKKNNLIIDEKGRPILTNRAQWIDKKNRIAQGWDLVKRNHGLNE